ncbi:MAG: DoxX family membrane protein [Bacteroidales bacterium]|nr:DoxX family membrane protein [Bacteroidales bacterium]
MKYLTTIGRILFALPFAVFGLNHFFMVDFYTGMLTSFIPGSSFTILLTGLALIAASISIIIKRYIKLSCILLAIMLLLFILTIHIPQLFDASTKMFAMVELLKDLALMGGALMIAGIYQKGENESGI